MQYRCAQCRYTLTTGQTMCRCGQVFSRPVPDFDPDSASRYWPPAEEAKAAAWFNSISPAVKAAVFGVLSLGLTISAVGGSIHYYQGLRSQFAPGKPVIAASIPPAHAKPAGAQSPPSMPAPIILAPAPEYMPPTGHGQVRELPTPMYAPPPSAVPGRAVAGVYSTVPSPPVDGTPEAMAATQDAIQADIQGQVMLPVLNVPEQNWAVLEARVAADRDKLSALQSTIKPEQYDRSMQEIERSSRSLDQNQQTWEKARAQSGINIS